MRYKKEMRYKKIWDTKKKRYEIQKNCAPSTEVVTGPGSFPAPHENTFRENHISSFRIFYTLWMVQLYIEMVDKYKQIYFITYLLRLCSKPMLKKSLSWQFCIFIFTTMYHCRCTEVVNIVVQTEKGGNAMMSFISFSRLDSLMATFVNWAPTQPRPPSEGQQYFHW